MTYWERFSGDYEASAKAAKERREGLVANARSLEPENLSELLAASEDGVVEIELDWVETPDPLGSPHFINVRPSLVCGQASLDAEDEKDRFDQGAYILILEGRLPSGEARVIGQVTFIYIDGELKYEPRLAINMGSENNYTTDSVSWDSADAGLFLTAAEVALAAQSK